jgi:hypothetical protein
MVLVCDGRPDPTDPLECCNSHLEPSPGASREHDLANMVFRISVQLSMRECDTVRAAVLLSTKGPGMVGDKCDVPDPNRTTWWSVAQQPPELASLQARPRTRTLPICGF